MSNSIFVDNLSDKELIHQRCVLVKGKYTGAGHSDGHVEILTLRQDGKAAFPAQRWLSHGLFKALVVLVPGENTIRIVPEQNPAHCFEVSAYIFSCRKQMLTVPYEIRVQYIPLLQTPPLYLAIMVARDSPLLIDCPPRKFGSLSSAHSGLAAAISKLRVSAYMWQALMGEEMRCNGLGRRSFRLEEEWAPDTLSYNFANHVSMASTAKVHLVRTDKTVAELRNTQIAQQNPNASRGGELHDIFTEALMASGAPFTREARPVVAGMILDSHYDTKSKLVVAHAALGAHNPNGLSLGIFGSHLAYSWPRFMEEIPDCLLDVTPPGDRVGNDYGKCSSMWEACSVGQGAFLHEVGHAFSAPPHTSGIMSRGYSQYWPKSFLAKTAYCVNKKTGGISPVTEGTRNDCYWDIRDLIRFRNLVHFQLPSDTGLNGVPPDFKFQDDDDVPRVTVTCEAGIVQVFLNGVMELKPSVANTTKSMQYVLDQLGSRFDKGKPLTVEVVSMNGAHRSWDMWKLFSGKNCIRIPGAGILLTKVGVGFGPTGDGDWPWVVMIKKRDRDGKFVSVSKVDIRVVAVLDAGLLIYKDGSIVPWPRGRCGRDPGIGGHQAKRFSIPRGVDIAKVGVIHSGNIAVHGLRMFLPNGNVKAALNKRPGSVLKVLGMHSHFPFTGALVLTRVCRARKRRKNRRLLWHP
jgi:hypothetical protein